MEWTYIGPLWKAPEHYALNGARAAECPDFFPLDGRWVLIAGLVGYTEPETGRHNLLYALVGDFVNDRFVPDSGGLQVLDFGTDFYAMQSFAAGDRQLAFAWLFNWETRKPGGSLYSGEMSLPRELSLDDAKKTLLMHPAAEIAGYFAAEEKIENEFFLPDQAFRLTLKEIAESAGIRAYQDDALSFEILIDDGRITIRLPQDDGSIRYASAPAQLDELVLFHDCGIIELFAANGSRCGTRRNYTFTRVNRLIVHGAGTSRLAPLKRHA